MAILTNPLLLPQNKIAGTDIAVSPLGLGTVKLGRNQQIKYPDDFEIPDDQSVTRLLEYSQAMGINLLDTAPAYGTSEERLGNLLGYRRKEWIICSKVGEEFENNQSLFNFSPEHIRFSIERSLKRLNTDYIDIVLVHSSGDDIAIIQQYGCLDVLEDLKKEGWIRASGMSTKTTAGGIMALKRSDIAMVTYNLLQQSERSVLDFAEQQAKGIFIKKPLASGHVCSTEESNPIYQSMKLIFSHPAVSSAIIGTINPIHLTGNIEVVSQLFDSIYPK